MYDLNTIHRPILKDDILVCTSDRMIECMITQGQKYVALSDEYIHYVNGQAFVIVDVMTKYDCPVGITVHYFSIWERPKKKISDVPGRADDYIVCFFSFFTFFFVSIFLC